eukprot:142397-Pyramimonas_sp.AAC.1
MTIARIKGFMVAWLSKFSQRLHDGHRRGVDHAGVQRKRGPRRALLRVLLHCAACRNTCE